MSSPQSSRNHLSLTPCTPKTSQMSHQNLITPTHKCQSLKIKVLCRISVSKTSHRNMFTWHFQRMQSFNNFIFFHIFIRSSIALLLKNTPKLCLWKTEIPTTSGLTCLYLNFPLSSLVRGKFCIGNKSDVNKLIGISALTPSQRLEEIPNETVLLPDKPMLSPWSRSALRSSNWKKCVFYLNVLFSKAN